MTLPLEKRTNLIKLLGMMGSAHDGEVLNAARLAQRALKDLRVTWQEVFSSPGQDRYQDGYADGYRRGLAEGTAKGRSKPLTWRALSKLLLEEYESDLTPWEVTFVSSFLERGYPTPTAKQQAIFKRIDERVDCGLPS